LFSVKPQVNRSFGRLLYYDEYDHC
jgi:hypothetical protein